MFYRWMVFACMMALVGCGEATTSVEPPSPAEQATVELERIAKTGMVDSTVFLLRESLEELKRTDATKAEELLKSLDELEKLQDKEKVRKNAAEMISKLLSSVE